ncbi:MAG: O-antigen ligase family protein [Caulobacteraceae bacterium]
MQLAILEARRETLGLGARARSISQDIWSARLATALVAASLLFLLIGPAPYVHERPLDPETGAAILSPLNRYAWFALTGLAAPLLWLKRSELVGLCLKLWPLFILYAWFAASTSWALDPSTSQRRLILLLCQAAVCAACGLGLRRPQAMHPVMAVTCAVVVLIDLASWILLPSLSQTEIGLAAIHSHKNFLGLAMMFAEFVCVPYLFTQRSWLGRGFWLFIVFAAMALMIASLSKTSLAITVAALVAAPILLAVLACQRTLLLGIVATILALLLTAVAAWLCLNALHGADPLAPLRGVTFTQRTDVWQFVISEIVQRPLKGVGFASFWDIDPSIQPSLQTDLWFAQPESPTNEAHDGYLDLMVSTGLIGLSLAVVVLVRWIGRGLLLLHRALRSQEDGVRARLPYLTFLSLFPILIALHNLLESSYFSTAGLFGFMVVFMGIHVELQTPQKPAWIKPKFNLKREIVAMEP